MSLFCSPFPSKSGPIVSKLAPRQIFTFLYSLEPSRSIHSHATNKRKPASKQQKPMACGALIFEAWFINSLANVGYCYKHSPRSVSTLALSPSRWQSTFTTPQKIIKDPSRRWQHTREAEDEYFTGVAPRLEGDHPNTTKQELLDLVDQYGGESYTDQLPLLELPKLYQPSDGPFLTVSDKEEDEWPPPHRSWYADPETRLLLDQLEEAVRPVAVDPEEIYQLYRSLPEPRAPYLESRTRHKMLHHLAAVERKDEHAMLRYLSVVDDMKGAAIPLTATEWNSAISYVARYVNKSTELECEAALRIWREMEHIAGVKGNSATLNILFDVACKAGKFTLAEMIDKERHARGFEVDRYGHVAMIFYYGLQRSGDGARSAYRLLVQAGEIVDTVVLNAMISALIRSYETSAAENIYERMKRSHTENPDSKLPSKDFRKRRSITRILKKMALIAKIDEGQRKNYQSKSIIAPDLQTFRILVRHFAVDVGDMEKTARLLEEMSMFELPVHGAMFIAIFRGFSKHGGIRYTQWTEARLIRVWQSFLDAAGNARSDVHLSTSMVLWILRAFAQCSGKVQTIAAWETIKEKWEPSEREKDIVLDVLKGLLDAPDGTVRRYDWVIGSL